jgi:DeoR family transcriptional regulator of aga operon
MMTETKTTVGRRARILEELQGEGKVDVIVLSRVFGVSEVTIRNDLSHLEQKGLLIRTRGGALKQELVGADLALSEKRRRHLKEKQKIGKKAAELIQDGDTVILDSGTTTMEIVHNLTSHSDLTIFTTALNIAASLANHSNCKVIMLGGLMREKSLSLVGAQAEENLKNYSCDKLFLGVDGIESGYGLSTPNMEEAHLNRIMIDVVKEVFLVTDSSKFLRRSFAFISSLEKIDTIITDEGIPEPEFKAITDLGINIIIV